VYLEGRWLKGYSLSGPVEGLSGLRQYPFACAAGTSSRKYRCIFHCLSTTLTSTTISRDAPLSDHQYQPGCVGGVVVCGRGL